MPMSRNRREARCRQRSWNWRNPDMGEWERTFAIITVPSNDLVGQIHDRMPAILKPGGYDRWLGFESDPRDLLITYPSEPMTMWPISTRVNKPENDDASLLDRLEISQAVDESSRHAASGLGTPPGLAGLRLDVHLSSSRFERFFSFYIRNLWPCGHKALLINTYYYKAR